MIKYEDEVAYWAFKLKVPYKAVDLLCRTKQLKPEQAAKKIERIQNEQREAKFEF